MSVYVNLPNSLGYSGGSGITVGSDNVISLNTATSDTPGGIKVGNNLSIDNNGVLSATDTTYTFDGTYNSTTNKAATVSTVTDAISALDVPSSGTGAITGFGAGKTLASLSETDGKISATFQDISIASTQVTGLGNASVRDVSTEYDSHGNKLIDESTLASVLSPYSSDIQRNTNILLTLVDNGSKNLLEMTQTETSITRYDVTATYNKQAGTVTLSGSHVSTDPGAVFEFYSGQGQDTAVIPSGTYKLSGCPSGGSTGTYRAALHDISSAVDTGSGVTFTLSQPHYAAYRILVSGNCDFSTPIVFRPMLCTQDEYDVSSEFEPYRPTYPKTVENVQSCEDMNSAQNTIISDTINTCGKNLLQITQYRRSITSKGIKATYDPISGEIDIDGTHDGTSGGAIFELYSGSASDQRPISPGIYHVSGCPAGGSTSTYRVVVSNVTGGVDTGSGADFTVTQSTPLAVRILISKPSGQTVSFDHAKFRIMVCKKSDWEMSQTFVPYCPTPADSYKTSQAPLAGKKISFYGDSITTFTGWIPSGNKAFYTGSNMGVSNVDQCWWKITLNRTGADLCVDQAWSGRCVSNIRDNETDLVNSGAWRQSEVNKLADGGTNPDIIIIKLGINDFNNASCTIGTYDGTEALPSVPENGFATFRESYATMLNRIMTTYPLARVYCCTLNQCERTGSTGFPEINGNSESLSEYNSAIRQLASAFGAGIIEHNACGMTYYNMDTYTGDWDSTTGKGLHPNYAGMQLIAQKTISTLVSDYYT